MPNAPITVTRRLADLFISESLAAKERESSDAYEFIDSQVEIYRDKLTDAEDKLKAYRGQNADARPGSEKDSNTRIGELRTQVENARMELMEQRSKESALVSQLSRRIRNHRGADARRPIPRAARRTADAARQTAADLHRSASRRDPRAPPDAGFAGSGQARRSAQRTQRTASRHAVRRSIDSVQFNPLYQELRSKLAEVRRNIAAQQSRMGASESLLNAELDRGRRIADSENKLSELTRDYEVNRDIYQDLLKRRENARVSMNLDADHRGLTFVIQEPAELPLRPSGLRFMHFSLAGLGAGVFLPLALLFGLVRFDPRVAFRHARSNASPASRCSLRCRCTSTRQDRWRSRRTTVLLILLVLAVIAAYAAIALMKTKMFL